MKEQNPKPKGLFEEAISHFSQEPAHGLTMAGWDFSKEEILAARQKHHMLNPAFELATNICPWNCDFCFTESPVNMDGKKRRATSEISLEDKMELISSAAELGAKSINIVGAGEPTIDKDFWTLIEYMGSLSLTPILYTEGSLKLSDLAFCKRLYEQNVTVVLKMNSLNDHAYQDKILRGTKSKSGVPLHSYSKKRDQAIRNLFAVGFNSSSPTRFAFDTIICKENISEIPEIHRFARKNNIFILLVNYLPSGRTSDPHTSAVTWKEQHALYQKLREVDIQEFGFSASDKFPYGGCTPCTIRGFGLYAKIDGSVFDCPGQSRKIGNIKSNSLAELWEDLRLESANWTGGCLPRTIAWKEQGKPFPQET